MLVNLIIYNIILIPREYIHLPYNSETIYTLGHLALRPETTEATYAYARQAKLNLPHVIWTHSRSARPEPGANDSMHMHEFWQLEFQCLHEPDGIDYQNAVLEPLRQAVIHLTKRDTQIVSPDTMPDYSPSVKDIMVSYGEQWVEVASVLIRNDSRIEGVTNLEIGFGTDRLLELSLNS